MQYVLDATLVTFPRNAKYALDATPLTSLTTNKHVFDATLLTSQTTAKYALDAAWSAFQDYIPAVCHLKAAICCSTASLGIGGTSTSMPTFRTKR